MPFALNGANTESVNPVPTTKSLTTHENDSTAPSTAFPESAFKVATIFVPEATQEHPVTTVEAYCVKLLPKSTTTS